MPWALICPRPCVPSMHSMWKFRPVSILATSPPWTWRPANAGDVEQRLDTRLFKRNRSAMTLTPRGEDMVRLAGRMAQDVEAFERREAPEAMPFATGLVPAEQIMARGGLQFLTDMAKGLLPHP